MTPEKQRLIDCRAGVARAKAKKDRVYNRLFEAGVSARAELGGYSEEAAALVGRELANHDSVLGACTDIGDAYEELARAIYRYIESGQS